VSRRPLVGLAVLALAGCDAGSRAPGPMQYRWPEQLAWRIEYVAQALAGERALFRYAETKLMRVVDRGGTWVVGFDQILKTSQVPGDSMQLVPLTVEDTLDFYVDIGGRGELASARLGCDPAAPACADALPSLIRIELRRLVPRLAVWPVPRGGSWVDTLAFDDAARPRGSRGHVITRYTSTADTVIGVNEYWAITWRSVRTSFRRPRGMSVLAPDEQVEEVGLTLVDKRHLVPVFSTWVGALAAPPEQRQLGATGTGFRGRAYLRGSPFDPTRAAPR